MKRKLLTIIATLFTICCFTSCGTSSFEKMFKIITEKFDNAEQVVANAKIEYQVYDLKTNRKDKEYESGYIHKNKSPFQYDIHYKVPFYSSTMIVNEVNGKIYENKCRGNEGYEYEYINTTYVGEKDSFIDRYNVYKNLNYNSKKTKMTYSKGVYTFKNTYKNLLWGNDPILEKGMPLNDDDFKDIYDDTLIAKVELGNDVIYITYDIIHKTKDDKYEISFNLKYEIKIDTFELNDISDKIQISYSFNDVSFFSKVGFTYHTNSANENFPTYRMFKLEKGLYYVDAKDEYYFRSLIIYNENEEMIEKISRPDEKVFEIKQEGIYYISFSFSL